MNRFVKVPRNLFWLIAFNLLKCSLIKDNHDERKPDDFILPVFEHLQQDNRQAIELFLQEKEFKFLEETQKAYQLLIQVFKPNGNNQPILDTENWVLLPGNLEISIKLLDEVLEQYISVATALGCPFKANAIHWDNRIRENLYNL